ncbi:MAG: Crp/Fnr family transcriptional regulator [Terracidiphilus sp.]
MEFGSPQTRIAKRMGAQAAVRHAAVSTGRVAGVRSGAEAKGDGSMQPEARSRRLEAVRAHPVAELLECPPSVALLLNSSAQCINFAAGEIVFRQSEICRGLYLVLSGQFVRRTERLETRLTLSTARAGDLVELAAALGDGYHTYSLATQTAGSLLMLPAETLSLAFQSYPPLRMQLLEELAREVSRAYCTCCLSRTVSHRRGSAAA